MMICSFDRGSNTVVGLALKRIGLALIVVGLVKEQLIDGSYRCPLMNVLQLRQLLNQLLLQHPWLTLNRFRVHLKRYQRQNALAIALVHL